MPLQRHKNIRLLMGVPRSGTTLSCNILNQFDHTISLHEPINVSLLKNLSHEAACIRIEQFAEAAFQSIRDEGVVISKQSSGAIPDNPVALQPTQLGGLRQEIVELGTVKVEPEKRLNPTLIIKHNALFTALLESLMHKFECYAIIRNPIDVLLSWHSVNLPVNGGRIPAGEMFDPLLINQLLATPDVLDRQLIVLSWFFARFDKMLDAKNVYKYEDIVASGGRCLFKIASNDAEVINPFIKHLVERQHEKAVLEKLYTRLMASEGSYWKFYDKAAVSKAMSKALDVKKANET